MSEIQSGANSVFQRARNLKKPKITMSTLGKNGRFGNQIFQYAFLKIYAKQHNLYVETPTWIGQYLFGHDDPPISQQLPEFKERINRVEFSQSRILNSPASLNNVDLWGYFQYHTSYYSQYKDYFRSLFKPLPEIETGLQKAVNLLRSKGKTVIGIHLRRLKYDYAIFYTTPSDRYKEWLK